MSQTTSFTAFGDLYKLVYDINSLVGYTDGITGTTKLVKDASLASSILTVNYGNGTSKTIDFSGIFGSGHGVPGDNGKLITSITFNVGSGILRIETADSNDTYLTEILINPEQGATGPTLNTSENRVQFRMTNDPQKALIDAFHDFVGVFPGNVVFTNNSFAVLLPQIQSGGQYARPIGKTLRFFSNCAANSNKFYNIKEQVGLSFETILTIRPQEAYTMIWTHGNKWLIIPGITNTRSNDGTMELSELYEPLPV